MAKTKIPATLEEAFALLDAKLTADEKNELLQAEDTTDFHLGSGYGFRTIVHYIRIMSIFLGQVSIY